MRFKLTSVVLACAFALSAASAMADDAKKQEQPAPKPAQEQAEKTAEEKAAAEKAAAPKTDPAKSATAAQPGEQPKAAVNTLEDLFAAYGMPALQAQQEGAPEETVVWKESAPVIPKPKPRK